MERDARRGYQDVVLVDGRGACCVPCDSARAVRGGGVASASGVAYVPLTSLLS